MRLAAAVGGVVDRSRLRLRQGDQFRQAVRGQRRMRDQELVQQHEHGRRNEIAPRVVGQLAVQVRVDREGGIGSHEDGVSVGRALGDGVGGDDGVRAGLVLHDHGLAPRRLQLVGKLARHYVDAAAGRVRDDDAHRLRRPGLAEGCGGNASSTQASRRFMTILLLVLIMMQAMKIVIVGGGIGGLSLARARPAGNEIHGPRKGAAAQPHRRRDHHESQRHARAREERACRRGAARLVALPHARDARPTGRLLATRDYRRSTTAASSPRARSCTARTAGCSLPQPPARHGHVWFQ